ncbi:Mevalonate kinase [Actinomortierella wolfii]|nr:Mevalonate kinase [Actinomortierella wolfii]
MPAFFTSSPGKVILFGEHAVVYGKVATAGSLGLRSTALIQTRTDQVLSVVLPDVQLDKTWQITEVPVQERWAEYPFPPPSMNNDLLAKLAQVVNLGTQTNRSQAAIALLYLHAHLATDSVLQHGFDFSVRSSLPVGAGLGSSASYSVCVATALLQINGYLTPDMDNAAKRDLINQWAFQAEKVIHGNPSGIDNTVSTFGGAVAFKKGHIEPLPEFQSLRFLLTNTRVPRETQVQVANVRKRRDRFPNIIDPLLDSIDSISVSCKQLFNQHELTRAELLAQFGDLIDINHGLLISLGVSHPALEKVREISSKLGLKSKLTGAGGGGCALTLIRDDVTAEVVSAIKALLHAEGFECFETSVGGPGAGVLPLPGNIQLSEFLQADKAALDARPEWQYFS